MRKKLLFLLAAAFLCLAVEQSEVYAEEIVGMETFEEVNVETEEQNSEKLAAPTNVRWGYLDGYAYKVKWDAVENANGRYEVVICKDGVEVDSFNCIYNISGSYDAEVGYMIEKHGTGNYTVKVRAKALATFYDNENDSEYGVTSESFAYNRPETQLATPTDLQWNDKVITWNPVYYAEDLDKYIVALYRNGEFVAGDTTLTINYSDTERIGYNFAKKMTKSGLYTVEIIALSVDINSVASSEVAKSTVFEYKVPVEEMSNIEAFVERMYTIALGRESEVAGLSDWSDKLQYWEIDGAGIAHGFIMSPEFNSRNLANEEFVDVLYRTFFDRNADEGGRADWIGKLESGFSRGYVLRGFVNSQEFTNLCDEYGIVRGVMLEDGTPVNTGIIKFVKKLYLQALGRESDESGLNSWSMAIAAKAITPEDAAIGFFTSQEYLNKQSSNEEFVEALYIVFMGRNSDAEGKANWVNYLNAGATREEVINGFAHSAEFANVKRIFGL